MRRTQADPTSFPFRVFPKRSHTFLGLLGVVLVGALLLWLRHGYWLGWANDHMLVGQQDGYKNYMTIAWHVAHDSSYVQYRGMNYPFGEHVLFTDNQPIISAGLQWWSRHISNLDGHMVGVVNWILMISLLLGAAVLYLLLRRLHLPVWLAGMAAIGIAFLSPQYNRLEGHFALSHTWVIPLLLLLLSDYEERYSRRYQSLLIGLLVWVAAQIHFYYFGLAALFLGVYTLYQLVADPTWSNFRVRFSHLVVMVLLPFMLLNIWLHWTNYHTDRPANPFGFTHYLARWDGVFLPYDDFPLGRLVGGIFPAHAQLDFEAREYVGLVALAFLIWVLVRRFRLFERGWNELAYHRVHRNYLNGIFWASLVLLVFSLGFPFALPGMDWMVDYFGPLKQFRGLARFAWAFYYCINVLAFYVLWNKAKDFKGIRGGRAPWLRWVIVGAPALLLCMEAYWLQRRAPRFMPNALTEIHAGANHWLYKIDWKPYQAILPLPYYHVGSENIWLPLQFEHFQKVQLAALHSGRPDMGVNLSRTSLRQTMESIQLTLEPACVPEILTDLPDGRPLALLVQASDWENVRRNYPYLLEKAVPVYADTAIRVLSLSPDSIAASARGHIQRMTAGFENTPLYPAGAWRAEQPNVKLVYESYDSLAGAPYVFQGGGARAASLGDTIWLWNGVLPKGIYRFSLWTYAVKDMGMMPDLAVWTVDPTTGRAEYLDYKMLRDHLRTVVNGWACFDVPLEIRDDKRTVRLFIPPRAVETPVYIDEMLIRPAGVNVYRRQAGWLARNNVWYTLR